MKKKHISRELVKHLEKKTMTFREIQQFAWKVSRGVPLKEKVQVSRGYWCGGITKLFNSQIIGKHPKYGYFALPGTSKKRFMFNVEADPWSFRRNKNELHLQALKHPQIKKLVEKDGTIHEYI